MNTYDDKLEELLLAKDFEDLSASEQRYVAERLGVQKGSHNDPTGVQKQHSAKATYAAERTLRLRSRAVLGAESAPADPAGLAAIMERTRPRRGAVIPLWQAAAAVILVALLAWWGRGIIQATNDQEQELIASSDTVFQEVKVLDTIYLPGPDAESHPLINDQASMTLNDQDKSHSPVRPPKNNYKAGNNPIANSSPAKDLKSPPLQSPDKVAEAMAILPEPSVTRKSGGSQPASGYQAVEIASYTDKFSLGL